MAEIDRLHWEDRYTSGHAPVHAAPNRWLAAQAPYLQLLEDGAAAPLQALDVACGAGGTLLWLAARGWSVTGVDISAAALALAQHQLAAAGLLDHAVLIEADLDTWRPLAASCDLLTCFNFLDRRLWPSLRAAVRPQGLICFSTYHRGRLIERPHTNPDHLLAPGELAALVSDWGWRLLARQHNERSEAVLAQRPV